MNATGTLVIVDSTYDFGSRTYRSIPFSGDEMRKSLAAAQQIPIKDISIVGEYGNENTLMVWSDQEIPSILPPCPSKSYGD